MVRIYTSSPWLYFAVTCMHYLANHLEGRFAVGVVGLGWRQDTAPPHHPLVRVQRIHLQPAQARDVHRALPPLHGPAPAALDRPRERRDVVLLPRHALPQIQERLCGIRVSAIW